eukprot:CAMPEP_0182900514 /NCGR_PEP_ID=MMETSP0034_2-20130328/28909_1 /TAXON_ID=156128 /ORGANISM="Nephroselmis pyriformis, Strain CCMP717" /LENGTH=105 /DNA_ID=CAMNT_0025034737 /DNA_START=141 /DNA_END=455 /DNA_ORIENTATION=-
MVLAALARAPNVSARLAAHRVRAPVIVSGQRMASDEDPGDGKAERKAAKKAAKAAARAKREGNPLPGVGQKDCDSCNQGVDLLIRCQTDASGQWRMVCGKCWKGV